MTTKRNNGSGSVYQRKDGRWVAQVVDPVTNKKIGQYLKTKNAANKALREMLTKLDAGLPAQDANISLRDYTEEWLKAKALRKRSESTVYAYGKRFELYVFPLIGTKRLNQLTVRDIEKVLDSATAQQLSHATVNGIKNALGTLLQDAMKERLISSNPARLAEIRFKQQPVSKQVPSTNEVREIIKIARNKKGNAEKEIGRILQVCALTGARIGEVLAMKWSDLDIENQSWNVSRTATRDTQGKTKMGDETKTRRTRKVLLSKTLIQLLREQRIAVKQREIGSGVWTDFGLVFPDRFGQLRDSRNLKRLVLKYFPEWKYGFHAFRAWFISYGLLESGASDVQVARLVGHAKTSMTKDIYGRQLDEGALLVTSSIENVLR